MSADQPDSSEEKLVVGLKSYLAWIKPDPADPEYSLMRAHLLFERLLDEYLVLQLPHPQALKFNRLSFAQKLDISKAVSTNLNPSDWRWKAVDHLNQIRNKIAHPSRHGVKPVIQKFLNHCMQNHPYPDFKSAVSNCAHASQSPQREDSYSPADVVTLALYLELRHGLDLSNDGFTND